MSAEEGELVVAAVAAPEVPAMEEPALGGDAVATPLAASSKPVGVMTEGDHKSVTSKQGSPTTANEPKVGGTGDTVGLEAEPVDAAREQGGGGEGEADAKDQTTVSANGQKVAEAMRSALKGKSGQERASDRKLRFKEEVELMESPSFITMFGEETDNPATETDLFERLYQEAKVRAERAAERAKKAAAEEYGLVDNEGDDGEKKEGEGEGKEEENEEGKEKKEGEGGEEGDEKKKKKDNAPQKLPNPPGCTFSPELSDHAKSLGKYKEFSQFLEAQVEHRKKSEKTMAAKTSKQFTDTCPPLFEDMPRKTTVKILAYLEKEKRYRGPVRGWRARYKKYVLSLLERQKAASNDPLAKYQNESVHSGLVRDEAVFQRLYNEFIVREAAMRVIEQTRLEKEARELFHPITHSSRWLQLEAPEDASIGSSSVLDASAFSSRSSVFDELYAYGEEYRRRREERAAYIPEDVECTFKPYTNPNSRKIIVERAIMRANGEIPERPNRHQVGGSYREDPAHNPGAYAITSPERPKKKFNADIFCSRVERAQSAKLERIAAMRRNSKLEELTECTFRPSITRTSESIATRRGYGQVDQTSAIANSRSVPAQSQRQPSQHSSLMSPHRAGPSGYDHGGYVRGRAVSWGGGAGQEMTSPMPRLSSIRPEDSMINGLPPAPHRSPMTSLQEPSPITAKRASHNASVGFRNGGSSVAAGSNRAGGGREYVPQSSQQQQQQQQQQHEHEPLGGNSEVNFAEYLQNLESELKNVISEWTTGV